MEELPNFQNSKHGVIVELAVLTVVLASLARDEGIWKSRPERFRVDSLGCTSCSFKLTHVSTVPQIKKGI